MTLVRFNELTLDFYDSIGELDLSHKDKEKLFEKFADFTEVLTTIVKETKNG